MTNKRGKKLKKKGSQDFQSSSRAIEKRLMQRNMQRIPVSPTYGYAPAYSNIHHGTVQGESIPCTDQFPGYIFMCNGKTKADCYKYRVFGLPAARMDILEKIKPHMRLFLFDFDLKLLYGVYIAASDGKLAIEPAAFGGQFSAQVRFDILRDCIPLPESTFKPAIADNYKGGSKFRQELSNKQVANLLSLFHSVVEPSPGIVGSLMPNTVQSATIVPRSSEIRRQTAPELSYKYDQYLARSNPIRHVQPELSLAHAPHALLTNRDLPPHLVSQSQFGPFNSAEAYQAHCHENPVLLHRRYTGMPYETEGVMLQQLEPRNYFHAQGKTAAYWVQMASEDPKGVFFSSPTNIGVGSKSIGVGSKSIGASDAVVAQASSAVQEINDTEPVTQLQLEASLHSHAYLHTSSSGAVYSVVQASQDPAQMYAGPVKGLPSVGPGFGADSVSTSLSETAPAAALEISNKENILQVARAYNYNPGMSVSSANIPVQAHNQLLHQVPVQAHGQLLPHVSAQLNSSAHPLPPSASHWAGVAYQDQSQVYQYYAQMPSSENSAVYWTGVAHDPNHVYQHPHLSSTGNNAQYWTGVAYQDPSQAYQDPHLLTYGQIGSYNHNVAVNDPSLQVQAYDPSYVAAASHVPSST